VPWAEDRPATSVPGPVLYHQLVRLGRVGWGWALLGVLAVGLLVFVGAQVLLIPVIVGVSALGVEIATDPVTPAGLAWVNLAWALAIPLTFAVYRVVHGLRVGWLSSVLARIRWRWLLVSLALAALALAATLVVAAFLPAAGGGTEMGGAANDFTRRTAWFVVVIVLLTPLQAAGEEYVFRGYLTQTFGGLVGGRIGLALAVTVPAVLFALAHGAQDPPVFVDRLAFGLVAGALVVLTGGLEAAIAMHVLNNWLAFGLALAFGDINASLHPESSTWWTLPTTLTQSLVFLGLTVWVARRTGVATSTRGPVLEARRGRV
jgi:uncharacterized protein